MLACAIPSRAAQSLSYRYPPTIAPRIVPQQSSYSSDHLTKNDVDYLLSGKRSKGKVKNKKVSKYPDERSIAIEEKGAHLSSALRATTSGLGEWKVTIEDILPCLRKHKVKRFYPYRETNRYS